MCAFRVVSLHGPNPQSHTRLLSAAFKWRFRSWRRTSGPTGCCWTSWRLAARCQLQTLRGWLSGNSGSYTLSNLKKKKKKERITHLNVKYSLQSPVCMGIVLHEDLQYFVIITEIMSVICKVKKSTTNYLQ